jgi:hypothetical protein
MIGGHHLNHANNWRRPFGSRQQQEDSKKGPFGSQQWLEETIWITPTARGDHLDHSGGWRKPFGSRQQKTQKIQRNIKKVLIHPSRSHF